MIDISKALQGLPLKPGAQYPHELPPEIKPFYCYPIDCGHSILILPATFQDKHPVENWLVPAPVKTVLRLGWKKVDGVPVVSIDYDPDLGLVVPSEDEER